MSHASNILHRNEKYEYFIDQNVNLRAPIRQDNVPELAHSVKWQFMPKFGPSLLGETVHGRESFVDMDMGEEF